MALQKKDVFTAIAAKHVHFARVLLGGQDGEHLVEFGDFDDWLVALEGARDGDLQIFLR